MDTTRYSNLPLLEGWCGLQFWRVLSAVLLTTMFLGWPNASFVEAEDSITFFTELTSGTATFHPNHLLFEPAYQTFLLALPGVPPLLALQTLTAFFALFGLLGLYTLVAPRNGAIAALLTTWLTATTFTYWHYGKVIDAYVPALACAIWSLVFFSRHVARPSTRNLLFAAPRFPLQYSSTNSTSSSPSS